MSFTAEELIKFDQAIGNPRENDKFLLDFMSRHFEDDSTPILSYYSRFKSCQIMWKETGYFTVPTMSETQIRNLETLLSTLGLEAGRTEKTIDSGHAVQYQHYSVIRRCTKDELICKFQETYSSNQTLTEQPESRSTNGR